MATDENGESTRNGSGGAGGFLTKRWGPLPVWGWGIAAVAGVAVFIYVRRKQTASSTAAAAAAAQQQQASLLTPGGFDSVSGGSMGGLLGAGGGPGTFSSTLGGGAAPAATASGATTASTPTNTSGRTSMQPVGVQGYQTPGAFTGANAPAASAYVQGLYEQYLGRAGDPSGVQYWTGQLTGGASPSQVAYEIANSPEVYTIRAQGFQPAGV